MTGSGSGDARAPSFGARLRDLRRAAGLTQEQLAERAGLTANGVSALERGTRSHPYPHTVHAIVRALDLPAAERERLLASARRREETVAAAPTPLALPRGAGALIGRDRDLATVVALVGAERLVTLTGTGGVGKTRLAVEAARESAPDYAGGTAFVPLAGLSDPALLVDAVAHALGLPDAGGAGAPALVDRLRDRRSLIVLDNLEHLLDAAGDLAELLERCPSLTVLATSRAPLRLRAEVEHVVEPLAVPPSTRREALEHVRSSPAAQLLLARARAAAADLDLTDETAGALAAICWRLGGLPLALELAAPKLRILSPGQLLDRLDEALASGWARDLPPRQRTLQSTIDWSYGLLTAPERRLFVRLSVFAGGFDLEAVEAVAGDADQPVLGLLEALVDQSLVRVTRGARGVRYALLEPVRQYAASLAARSGDEDAAHAAHASHYLDLAERAAPEYRRSEQVAWLDRTDTERDNLRAAIAWSLLHDDGDTAGRLLWALWLAAWIQGWLHEARALALAALQRPLSVPVRVRCLCVAASTAWGIGDWDAAREGWAAAVEVATAAGDDGRVYGVTGLGLHAMGEGRTDEASERFTAAVAEAERLGDEWLVSLCLVWLGTIRMVTGEPDAAVPLLERGRLLAQRRGDRLVIYAALFNLAQAAMARADWPRARALLEEGVMLSVETGDRANLAYYLESIAVVDGEEGLWERAAVLVGAAQGLREAAGARTYHYYLPDESLRAAAERGAWAALGEPAYAAAVRRGRQMELHEVTAAATRSGGG